MIRKVLPLVAAFALTFSFAAAASAQEPVTAFAKQLSRVDLALSASGQFNKNSSGPVTATGSGNTGQVVGNNPSTTVGALFTIRYIARPLVGLEFNYGYARYTENYTNVPGISPAIGVQSQVNEYTVGYVVTPVPSILGFKPFASVGAGSTAFKPTAGGGLGLKTQARATYYYSAGLQQEFLSSHFGLRAAFRQSFFLAPDFGQNYLTIKQRTNTIEPTIGFYLKF